MVKDKIFPSNIKKIHLVGIGGSGMSGLAKILANEGYKIQGSDLVLNKITQYLTELGITIFGNHHSDNIKNANLVVVSSAIDTANNPEIIAAKKAKIPVITRSEMLSELIRFRYGIAITGTHGKSTTTGMVASIYITAGLKPTFINGASIKSLGINAKLGNSNYFIIEVDESNASFLKIRPIIAIVTNLEEDHLDNYQGNFNNLKLSLIKFVHNLPFYGNVIMCIDDPVIRELIPMINRNIITYGFTKSANFNIINYDKKYSTFTICRKNKQKLDIKLSIPGRHNALNAAAAIALATTEGISDKYILQALIKYKGTDRRFDYLGNYFMKDINNKYISIILIDDYGHHPTEIFYTINTSRDLWPKRRIVMVFQPHRYTRTRYLYNDFIKILSTVDVLIMLEIDSAGENSIPGINTSKLCHDINLYSKINPIIAPNIDVLLLMLTKKLQDNDLLIMQGAGSISNITRLLVNNKLLKLY